MDTARLGQMLPAARDAQIDFVRLASEEPSSLYFEQFLREGFSSWPSFYQDRFPGLHSWQGVTGLKQAIRQLAGTPDDWRVLLAGRSLSLVHLASTCMFRVCRNVLTTDLSWPTYQNVVNANASRTGNRVTNVPVRNGILYHGWSVGDVSRYLADAFAERKCDGLFLPAVDHLGVRLPLAQNVEEIQTCGELRFCFIDAAQAFCHVDLEDCVEYADFIVAGSHKWMGAYMPTAIGLFGQRHTREIVEHRLRHLIFKGYYCDPLIQFTEQLTRGKVDGYSQTANLANLFASAGAAAERLASPIRFERMKTEVNDILNLTPRFRNAWIPVIPQPEFQTRISLLRHKSPQLPNWSDVEVRREWLDAGCIVSGYDGGLARLSFQ